MKILIADDEPVARRLLEKTLQQLGHEVTVVANGRDALAHLLAPEGPRIAIIDWMMPGTDGLGVCRAVRQRSTPYVYVILLTARDRPEDIVEGLEAGADDFLSKPLDAGHLRARLRSGERVITLEANLLEAQAALEHQATHDRLTGLWNRGMIVDHLTRTLGQAEREGKAVAAAMGDLDAFKAVNDRHGHGTGDAVLIEVTRRMRSVVRKYDALGRYGGEEFLLVVGGDAALAVALADRVRGAVRAEPVVDGAVSLAVTVSFGVASTRETGYHADGLIDAADRALYRAKAAGRDRVVGPDDGP
jgi:two-component system cell cycle response regulator